MYYLGTCSTCAAIIKETGIRATACVLQDIKTEPITAAQLDAMKQLAGSYEALFSKRAMKYASLGLKNQQLTEKDFRRYILEEYTFLKRPVTIVNNTIFIGSDKKAVAALKASLSK